MEGEQNGRMEKKQEKRIQEEVQGPTDRKRHIEMNVKKTTEAKVATQNKAFDLYKYLK